VAELVGAGPVVLNVFRVFDWGIPGQSHLSFFCVFPKLVVPRKCFVKSLRHAKKQQSAPLKIFFLSHTLIPGPAPLHGEYNAGYFSRFYT